MASITSHGVSERVHFAPLPVIDGPSDGELLDQFITAKDDAAFAELVRRHASMVLGVCQRVLHNVHDAEDCFQAVFLVLVRKADTIHPRQMVGNWLYGVAYRTALEARKLAARRRTMERKKPAIVSDDDRSRELWQDLGPLLDQELNRLPDKYRAVLVACDLEGQTREEAARELGLPEGTVASRLARGRALLTKRMTRHSFAMTTTGLAALLLEHAAAEVPETLLTSTIDAGSRLATGQPTTGVISRNVATLTEAVVHGFVLAKLKVAGAVLMILLALGLGVGALIPSAQAERNPGFNKPEAQKTAVKPEKVKPRHALDCILQKIDTDNQTIAAVSAAAADGDPARYELHVGADTQIVIDGREATLAELPVGAAVNLQWDADASGRRTAIRIEAAGKKVKGAVKTDAAGKKTILFDGVVDAVNVADDVPILIDGKKSTPAELKTGARVTLQMSALSVPGVIVAIRCDDR